MRGIYNAHFTIYANFNFFFNTTEKNQFCETEIHVKSIKGYVVFKCQKFVLSQKINKIKFIPASVIKIEYLFIYNMNAFVYRRVPYDIYNRQISVKLL